jgi:hypothetical protein
MIVVVVNPSASPIRIDTNKKERKGGALTYEINTTSATMPMHNSPHIVRSIENRSELKIYISYDSNSR